MGFFPACPEGGQPLRTRASNLQVVGVYASDRDRRLTKPVYILGISAYYHDSAAALLRDGEIIAAASEERFTRIKGDSAFPARAVAYCLKEAGMPTGNANRRPSRGVN